MTRQSPRPRYTQHALIWALLLSGSATRGDGFIVRRGMRIAPFPSPQAYASGIDCGGDGDACATRLLRALTGLTFGSVATAVGESRSGAAGAIAFVIASVSYPLGTAELGRLAAMYVRSGTARVEFTAADVPAVFSCRDLEGELHPPALGHMLHACAPGSRLGVGTRIAELSWDPNHGRGTARWGELSAIVNVIGPTSSMEYLRHHLDVGIGFGGETVWHGDGEARSGTDHLARGAVAMNGVVRSEDGHWEATLQAAYRPALFGTVATLLDYGITADVTGFYNLLVNSNAVISAGIDVRASRWSDPSTAIGSFSNTTNPSSLFAGVVLRVKRETQP